MFRLTRRLVRRFVVIAIAVTLIESGVLTDPLLKFVSSPADAVHDMEDYLPGDDSLDENGTRPEESEPAENDSAQETTAEDIPDKWKDAIGESAVQAIEHPSKHMLSESIRTLTDGEVVSNFLNEIKKILMSIAEVEETEAESQMS